MTEFRKWRDITPNVRPKTAWITAEQFEEQVAQAKAWQVEARADHEFYKSEES